MHQTQQMLEVLFFQTMFAGCVIESSLQVQTILQGLFVPSAGWFECSVLKLVFGAKVD